MTEWKYKLETKCIEARAKPVGTLPKSSTLGNARNQGTFRENIRVFANCAHDEAKSIFNIARQLEGNPYKSQEYLELCELNRQLCALDALLSGNHTFTLPASVMAEEVTSEHS